MRPTNSLSSGRRCRSSPWFTCLALTTLISGLYSILVTVTLSSPDGIQLPLFTGTIHIDIPGVRTVNRPNVIPEVLHVPSSGPTTSSQTSATTLRGSEKASDKLATSADSSTKVSPAGTGTAGSPSPPPPPPPPATTTPRTNTWSPGSTVTSKTWLAILRIQKTATKSVVAILEWLLATHFKGPASAKSICNCGKFATSDVPSPLEVAAADMSTMPPQQWPSLPTNIWGPWRYLFPASTPATGNRWDWYTQQILPGRSRRACAGFDTPEDLMPAVQCKFLAAHHMSLGDILGVIAASEARKNKQLDAVGDAFLDDIGLIATLRHPVKRVLSEYRHIGRSWKTLWDTCIGWKPEQVRPAAHKQPVDTFCSVLAHPAHAYALRNRQTKMISGRTVEPPRPLPSPAWDGFGTNGTGWDVKSLGLEQLPESDTEYQAWAQQALADAKRTLSLSAGIVLTERLAESVGVLLVTLQLPVYFTDVSSLTPEEAAFAMNHSRELLLPHVYPVSARDKLWANAAQYSLAQEGAYLEQHPSEVKELAGAPMKLALARERYGPHMDQTLHINFTACGMPAGSGESWSTTWDGVLCMANGLLSERTIRDPSDGKRVSFELTPQIQSRIEALNELDLQLWEFANEELDRRVHASRQWLEEEQVKKGGGGGGDQL